MTIINNSNDKDKLYQQQILAMAMINNSNDNDKQYQR